MNKLRTSLLIFFFLPLFSFSQDYWEHVYSIDTNNIISLQVDNDGTIYFGGAKGLFISNDDGQSWDFKFLFNYIWVYSLEFDCDSNLLVGASFRLYRYNIEQDSFYNLNAPDDVNFITIYNDSNYIFTNSDYNYILRYSDGEWNKILVNDDAGFVYAIVKDADGVLYVGTTGFDHGGGVFRSFDEGETWEYFGLHHYYIRSLAIDLYNRIYAGAIGHVSTGEGGFFRYNYQTMQWDTLSHNARVQSLFFNEEDSLFAGIYSAGGNGGAWMSPDYGDTWIKISSGLPNPNFESNNVEGITEDAHSHLYAIVGDQKSIYKSSDSTITLINEPFEISSDEIVIYPNPFTDSFLIKLVDKLQYNQLKIQLYNIIGRKQNIKIEQTEDDCLKVYLDKSCNTGIYFLVIQSTSKINSQKVIKY